MNDNGTPAVLSEMTELYEISERIKIMRSEIKERNGTLKDFIDLLNSLSERVNEIGQGQNVETGIEKIAKAFPKEK